jgi:hypothetical protein
MKMNKNMSDLLRRTNVSMTLAENMALETLKSPTFTVADGSVLLKHEYERAAHVKTEDFPDRTGYECFVNHVHLPFNGTRESLLSCLGYAVALQRGLVRSATERRFQVIVSVAEDDCTVRFHEVRPGENWLSEDLEGFAEEAIVVLCASPEE